MEPSTETKLVIKAREYVENASSFLILARDLFEITKQDKEVHDLCQILGRLEIWKSRYYLRELFK